jgi:hypothetical protein
LTIGYLVTVIEIEDYGDTVVANNVPAGFDAYCGLAYCDNVEREGEGSYRFDNVYDKRGLVDFLETADQ